MTRSIKEIEADILNNNDEKFYLRFQSHNTTRDNEILDEELDALKNELGEALRAL